MKFTEPILKVYPSRPDIDRIHVYRENNGGHFAWACNGYRNEKLVQPDLWYQEFYFFLRHLSDYVDNEARWTDDNTGEAISAWQGVIKLAEIYEAE